MSNSKSVSVVVGGDVVLHGPLHRPVHTNPVYQQLHSADAAFVNLEMPFATDGTPPAEKLITLKADPVHAPILLDMGVDVVTVANNHGMDYGFDGLRETIRALDAAGVAHVGGGENRAASLAPAVLPSPSPDTGDGVQRPLTVAFIGVTTTLPNGSAAAINRPGLAGVRVFTKYVVDSVSLDESPGMAPYVETETYGPDEKVLLDAIHSTASMPSVDVVVVGIHWGVPRGWVAATQDEIATYQRPLAQAMVDAGADAVVGHHPHIVQAVEWYKGVPIAYSLGNLVFGNSIVTPSDANPFRSYPLYQWTSLQTDLSNLGALLRLEWTVVDQDKPSKPRLARCVLVPLSLALEDGEPDHASEAESRLLVDRVQSLSTKDFTGTKVTLNQSKEGYYEMILSGLDGSC